MSPDSALTTDGQADGQVTPPGEVDARTHMLSELGFSVRLAGDELHGTADVFPEVWVPGTSHLRTSVLATWADTLTGLLAVQTMRPRVPVTIDLDVHLYRPAPGHGRIEAVGRRLKKGRSVCAASVEFSTEAGEVFGVAAASFMAAPDPSVRLPEQLRIDMPPSELRLTVPLAERAGCERRERGVAVLPKSDDGLNSSRTVNGGLIALVTEEAALSCSPGDTLESIVLRYLQPVRVGPVVAHAAVSNGLGQVELRDAGNDDRLSVFAVTRTFGR